MISSDSKVNPVKKAKKKLLLLVLLLAFCLSCSLSIAAEIDRSNDVKTINITFQELVTRASKYNILFNDWRDTPDKGTYHIVPGKLNSQKTWIEFLEKTLANYSILHKKNEIAIYLLNQGEAILAEQQGNKKVQKIFAQQVKAKKIVVPSYQDIPEIQTLKSLSEKEKSQNLHYERLINPHSNSPSSYNFDVSYNPELDMLLPYLKNGAPVKGKMEGFTSFSSFYNFIEANKGDIEFYRFGKWLYVLLKSNKQSSMAINTSGEVIEGASQARIPNGPELDIYIKGDQDNFKSYGKMYLPQGELTILDYVTTQ